MSHSYLEDRDRFPEHTAHRAPILDPHSPPRFLGRCSRTRASVVLDQGSPSIARGGWIGLVAPVGFDQIMECIRKLTRPVLVQIKALICSRIQAVVMIQDRLPETIEETLLVGTFVGLTMAPFMAGVSALHGFSVGQIGAVFIGTPILFMLGGLWFGLCFHLMAYMM